MTIFRRQQWVWLGLLTWLLTATLALGPLANGSSPAAAATSQGHFAVEFNYCGVNPDCPSKGVVSNSPDLTGTFTSWTPKVAFVVEICHAQFTKVKQASQT